MGRAGDALLQRVWALKLRVILELLVFLGIGHRLDQLLVVGNGDFQTACSSELTCELDISRAVRRQLSDGVLRVLTGFERVPLTWVSVKVWHAEPAR